MKALTEGDRPVKKFKQHTRSCLAYGNYQPPYEECTCGADTEGDRPEPCCNCLSKLPGYNVKAWRWLNPNVRPFCEDCWKEVKKGERTRRLRELLEQIEKALDRQKAACFGIDVREKWQSDNPVIQSVIDAPDAMHDLLFIRQALRAVLDTEGDRPMHDQEYYDKSRRINMGLEPAEGDASPAFRCEGHTFEFLHSNRPNRCGYCGRALPDPPVQP